MCAGAWLGFCLGALVLTTGIQFGDTQVFERIFGVLYAPDPAGVVDVALATAIWLVLAGLIALAARLG